MSGAVSSSPLVGAYDETRTRFIEGEGYRLLRFWNNDVLGNTKGVVRAIALAIAGKA